MQVHLKALGCRLNEAELQDWGQQFLDAGHQISTEVEQADLILFNSCAVTGEAARKSRQSIRRLHRSNPKAKLVVTGCYASLEPEQVAEILGVDLVVDNEDKDQLVDKVNQEFQFAEVDLPSMPAFATEPGEAALFARNMDRAFIKIQDGCRYRCTYCIVTIARGDERSRTIDDLVDEVNQQVEQGVQEIVLTGVHVGGYGSDLDTDLKALVEALLERTEMPRIRFASVEPWDLPDDFFKLFANPRLMPHMHLPLQSGADSVLRRMSRRCRQDSFESIVNRAREQVPGFNVTTDIIVGFPGETEEEWQTSLEYIEKIGFGHVHIFNYSHREGTKAARLPGAVSSEIKKARIKELGELAQKMKRQALEEQLGDNVEVLYESSVTELDGGLQRVTGYTPNYHRVVIESEDAGRLAGQVLLTELQNVSETGDFIYGKLHKNAVVRPVKPLSSGIIATF